MLASALKLLTKEPDATPVRLTAVEPLRSKKPKGDRSGGGGRRRSGDRGGRGYDRNRGGGNGGGGERRSRNRNRTRD